MLKILARTFLLRTMYLHPTKLLALVFTLFISQYNFAQQVFVTDGNTDLDVMDERINHLTYGLILLRDQEKGRLNQSDNDVVDIALESGNYLDGFLGIMQETCDYYRSTPNELIDSERLADAQSRAQRIELQDRLAYLESAILALSPRTRERVYQISENLAQTNNTKRAGVLDHLKVAAFNPENYIQNFANVCANVEEIAMKAESGALFYGESVISIEEEGAQQ